MNVPFVKREQILNIKSEIDKLEAQHQKRRKNVTVSVPESKMWPNPLKTNPNIRPMKQAQTERIQAVPYKCMVSEQ